MIDRPRDGQRHRPPLARDAAGPYLTGMVALTVYLATLGGIALILVGDTFVSWQQSISSSLTLQLPAEVSEARLGMTLALLRQTPGIIGEHVLGPDETGELLKPWLGPEPPLEHLPIPRLIDLHVDGEHKIDFADLREKLAAIVPGAQLDDTRPWLDDWRGAAMRAEAAIGAGVAAAILLAILSLLCVARIGLVVHGEGLVLLRLLGAEDGYIARQFQARAVRLALVGGLGGVAAATATLIALGTVLDGMTLPRLSAGVWTDWRLAAVLVGAVPAAGLVAAVIAGLTVRRRLARLP